MPLVEPSCTRLNTFFPLPDGVRPALGAQQLLSVSLIRPPFWLSACRMKTQKGMRFLESAPVPVLAFLSSIARRHELFVLRVTKNVLEFTYHGANRC